MFWVSRFHDRIFREGGMLIIVADTAQTALVIILRL